MKQYVLAFIFDSSLEQVLLIHKLRPEWQKGKVNGIGGKVEEGESGLEAVVRETKEETDLSIDKEQFVYLGSMSSEEWTIEVFGCVYTGAIADAKSVEEEKVAWFDRHNLPSSAIDNLPWLIPFAVDKIKNKRVKKIEVKY